MRQVKPKNEPFFVKRIRLRRSIVKTNEILEMISNYDQESIKYPTLSENFNAEQMHLHAKCRKITVDPANLEEIELMNSKSSRFNLDNMRILSKIQRDKKNSETGDAMGRVGLEVRRIVGDPRHKRSYQYTRDPTSKGKRQKQSQRSFNLTLSNKLTIDAFIQPSNSSQIRLFQRTDHNLEKCCTVVTPHKKNRGYLYERMANSEKIIVNQENQVYEKRIKSYNDFLWKGMISHNVYLQLDLPFPTSSKKMKAFVGYGNNCNMIKGLIKRRFWWSISEEMTEDCVFIWTQIKVNKIYERQEVAELNQSQYKDQDIIEQKEEDLRVTVSSSLDKRSKKPNTYIKNMIDENFNQAYSHHHKIWNTQDFNSLKKFTKKHEMKSKSLVKQVNNGKYRLKTEQVKKTIKDITFIQDLSHLDLDGYINGQQHNYYKSKPLVHNHLQNNFFLGNKKALFYNLREYYDLKGEDVFQYVPLTFHIREGFKDQEYLRFSKYFEQRARMIKQQESKRSRANKTRNIWIVKPGENSNQGRGITVIDEVYELNHIIKNSMQGAKPPQKDEENLNESKTFIVQMYLDRPFLYNDRKFDIRHYMLITNLYGITKAYWYDQGYIRTSAYQFNINNFQPEIHLTNDAIQKNYPDYGKYEPYNKISYSEFQNYLNSLPERTFNFKEEILTKMKVMAKDAARSVYNKISPQNQMHNFEIFGLDFMIDRNFKPWLIEINTNPCLDCTCPLLDRIIPYMVEQGLKLSLDLVYPPPSHYPNTNKHYAPLINLQTFKYELIFDSLNQGEELKKLYSKRSNILNQIGTIEEDQEFKDNGQEIKLQDFT